MAEETKLLIFFAPSKNFVVERRRRRRRAKPDKASGAFNEVMKSVIPMSAPYCPSMMPKSGDPFKYSSLVWMRTIG